MSIDKKKPDTSPADGVNTAADEAPDLDAVMRKYDRESATRLWEGTPQLIIRILMAAFGLFCIGHDPVFQGHARDPGSPCSWAASLSSAS